MTDKNPISRRSLLATTGAVGLTSLTGCLSPSSDSFIFGDGGSVRPDTSGEMRDVKVKQAPTDRKNPYFLAVSDDIIESSDITVFNGQQIRMKVQNDIEGEYTAPCIYTVNTNPEYTSEEEKTVWMSKEGMDRLGIVDGTLLILQPYAASPRFETRDSGQENNELIEQYIDKSNDVLFLAPHGGDLYSKTELQALRGSSIQDYSSWALMGYEQSREEALKRWYNPPELYKINSFLGLLELDYPFEYAVAFTGLSKQDNSEKEKIVIGGLAEDEIKSAIKKELEKEFTPSDQTNSNEDTSDEESSAGDSTEDSEGTQEEQEPKADPTIDISTAYEGELSGTEPRHIANNLSYDNSDGIIIQQSPSVRDKHWKEVADAIMRAIEEYY